MNDHEFEIAHHAVFMKGRVGAYKIDLAGVSHLMDDFIEKQIDPVVSFES